MAWEVRLNPAPKGPTGEVVDMKATVDAILAAVIFFVGKRAQFEMAISRRSLDEVSEKRDPTYLQWAYEVLGYWEGCLAAYGGRNAFEGAGASRARTLDSSRFGYLSAKDRVLLQDALWLECDAFLSLDRKLAKNADHIRRVLGL